MCSYGDRTRSATSAKIVIDGLPAMNRQHQTDSKAEIIPSMKTWRLVRVSALIFALAVSRAAADDEPPVIATDRPSVAASSIVVPSRAVQLENGVTDTASQGQHTFVGPESLLRVGVTTNTEVRLTLPNVVRPSGADSSSGATDLVLGVKQQIGREMKGFDVSLIVSLSLPTGSDAVSTRGYDPSVQLPWSRAVSPKLTVAGMLSLYTPTEGGSA
jgi:Putative MetA-pathway of phenol degradation